MYIPDEDGASNQELGDNKKRVVSVDNAAPLISGLRGWRPVPILTGDCGHPVFHFTLWRKKATHVIKYGRSHPTQKDGHTPSCKK